MGLSEAWNCYKNQTQRRERWYRSR